MIKLGNMELDKKQSIALIAGIILIIGAAGGYWFYGTSIDNGTVEEASLEDEFGDLEDEEGSEEVDLFGDEDVFDEGEGEDDEFAEEEEGEDLFGLFDEEETVVEGEENTDDFFGTAEKTEVMVEPAIDPLAVEAAKEKGNIIDLEGTSKLTEVEKANLPKGSLKDILKKETDVQEITIASSGDLSVEEVETVVVEKKPVPITTYRVRRGDSFDDVARKFGYPATFQSKLAFLEKNPSGFRGITETESGKLVLPLRAGKILKLPVKPLKRSYWYNRVGQNIETFVIEFYGSENEASAEVVRDTLMKNGHKAYIRPFGRTFQVMIGFFDNKAAAEKVIKESALFFGVNDDSINLLKLTRGRDSYDDYVAREREQFYVQIFASQNRRASQMVLDKAKKIQVKTSVLTAGKFKGRNMYKIRVGYFNSRIEAVVEAKYLKQNIPEVKSFFVKKGEM